MKGLIKLALSLTPRLTGQRVKNNQKYCDTTFERRDVIYVTPILNLFTACDFPQFKGQGQGKYYVLVPDHMLVLREPHDLHFQRHLIQVDIWGHFTQLSVSSEQTPTHPPLLEPERIVGRGCA